MGNIWHGLVVLLLCFGPRSEPRIHLLGTVSFGDFYNGARSFFDKQFYFFTKLGWKHDSQNVASIEELPHLQLPKLPFPEIPLPQRTLALSHPTWHSLTFWCSPQQALLPSLSPRLCKLSWCPKKWLTQLWLVPGHTFSQCLLQF